MRLRSIIRITLVTGGVLFLGVGFLWWVLPIWQEHHYANQLAQFESSPSEAQAKELVRLLDEQRVSPELGGRILAALARPQVVKRAAYPAGQSPVVELKLPYPVSFAHARIKKKTHKQAADGDNLGGMSGAGFNSLNAAPELFSMPSKKPGKCQIISSYSYSLFPERITSKYWSWNSRRPFPWNILPRLVTTSKYLPWRSSTVPLQLRRAN